MTEAPLMAPRDGQVEKWVIESRRRGIFSQFRELWRYRHLLRFFGRRSVERTYYRTVLGCVWLFVRPLFPIIASSLIFGGLLGVDSYDVPYFLFFMTGMTIWNLFHSTLMWVTRSIQMNRSIVKRIYFPRLLLPVSSMAPSLVNLLIFLTLIAGTNVYYALVEGRTYVVFGWHLLAAVASIALTLALALAIGLWTAVLGSETRDVRFTLGYILDFWFFLTPVIYPLSAIPERWRPLAMFNPVAPLVEGFKTGILGVGKVSVVGFSTVMAIIFLIGVGGLWFFNKSEATSVDRL